MKALAVDKSFVTQIIRFVFGRVENIVEKEESAGKLEFLCSCIDRLRAYSFWPVGLSICLYAKTFTLAIAFEWFVIEMSCFTYIQYICYEVKSFFSTKVKVICQGEGQI